MRKFVAATTFMALAACGLSGQDNDKEPVAAPSQASADYGYDTFSDENLADTMASSDGTAANTPAVNIADPEDRPLMQAQVVLDRRGFGPGVIDGKMGLSTENAIRGFQQANDIEQTGKLDEATKQALASWDTIPATRVVTIPASWGRIDYEPIPDEPEDQAKMERLGYASLDEKLAERFHTTVDVLKQLNPGGKPAGMEDGAATSSGANTPSPSATPPLKADEESKGPSSYFTAGRQVRVPNIGGDRIAPGDVENRDWQRTLASLGVGSDQPHVDRIVVSKRGGTLKAFNEAGDLVALFTVTSGSSHDPLPLGEWKIEGVAHNPHFAFDPKLFWDVADSEKEQQLPAGPNGPVGVVWIDLSKEHYGIHGTSEPQTIGRAQSHGCVRLTNWDAARLSEMVSPSTQVIFEA